MQGPPGDNGTAGRQGPLDVADLNVPPWAGRAVKWGLAGVALIFAIIGLTWGRIVYTDWLWFNGLGYLDVFKTILITRIDPHCRQCCRLDRKEVDLISGCLVHIDLFRKNE